MKNLFILLILLFASICHAQNKATIAVETFRFQPVSVTTQNYIQAKFSNDLKTIGDSFAASFTEKLRKSGYTVVTRRNIDSLLEENKLGQTGIVDDDGVVKLKSADFRIIGTIRQFEESQKSDGALGVLGAIAGRKVSQMQGVVKIVVEMIARDGTVLASASGKSTKYGRVNELNGVGGSVDGKIFGILSNSTRGSFSDAITNASNHSIDLSVKDLASQLKKIDLTQFAKEEQLDKTLNYQGYDFKNLRFVVSFPDSPVAEEVFINKLSDFNARVVIGNSFDRNIINSNTSLEAYCINLRKSSSNARMFVFGTIDSEKINQTTRITMSIRVVDLANIQIIHSNSVQNSVIDLSNRAGYDRVVKEASNKLIDKAFDNIQHYLNKAEIKNNVYSLELSGFQSLSSANRFLNLLNKNSNILSSEVIDFSNKTLFAEIKFKNLNNIAEILEKDTNILDMFVVNVKSISLNKISGEVIIR